jgi:hypothetical protein
MNRHPIPKTYLLSIIFVISILSYLPSHANSIRFIALGDMPYRDSDEANLNKLISSINEQKPDFSIFIGDTKSGSSPCTNNYLEKIFKTFNTFENALIYTPGDNEWTDCHRVSAGSFNPQERLEFIRQLYFQSDKSLGKQPIMLIRQADVDTRFKQFVENAYWIVGSTLFSTIHVVGSNNNFSQSDEYSLRNSANLTWLEWIFTIANQRSIKQIVIAMQADLFYSPQQASSTTSGLADTIRALNKHLSRWNKPVLVIHGDSHQLIIDQPFRHSDTKKVIEKAYRLQVMGDYQIEAIEVTVDDSKQSPFSFRPISIQ